MEGDWDWQHRACTHCAALERELRADEHRGISARFERIGLAAMGAIEWRPPSTLARSISFN
jgi:hypothetical protein